jgi:hypothetical protein
MIADPSGNAIELEAYADPAAAFADWPLSGRGSG